MTDLTRLPKPWPLNQLYDKMWIYYNLFQPVMHLQEKTHVSGNDGSSRVKRPFDEAQTPCERLCATNAIPQKHREQLERFRKRTNPRRLRKEIYDLIDHIFSLPGALPGVTEDVFQTLPNRQYPQDGEGIPVTSSFDRTITVR